MLNLQRAELFVCWVILHAFLLSPAFFKLTFSQTSCRDTVRVSNSLDPDQVIESYAGKRI